MKLRITFELDDVEAAMLRLMMHELLQNDPGAQMDPSKQVHDIVRTVLLDDYQLHQERIQARERSMH